MAKISANGAREVAALDARNRAGATTHWVLASNGRTAKVLFRHTGDDATGYKVDMGVQRHELADLRSAGRPGAMALLATRAARLGYGAVPAGQSYAGWPGWPGAMPEHSYYGAG